MKQSATFFSSSRTVHYFSYEGTICFSFKAVREHSWWQWSVVKSHKHMKSFFHHAGYRILRHSIKNWHPLNVYAHVTSSKEHISIIGWRRFMDTGPVLTPKKNWLICFGCTCTGKGCCILEFESNNASFRLFSYCSWFDKCWPFGTAITCML